MDSLICSFLDEIYSQCQIGLSISSLSVSAVPLPAENAVYDDAADVQIMERKDFSFKLKLDPAIKGTINVLTAAKAVGVRRVVVTSSVSAITQKELWYPLSKTLAEKAAWDFSRESGLDVVVVNPGIVMGPVIPPTINASMVMLVRLLQGCTETYENFFMGSIHFKDVALAHILVYENPSAF